MTPSTRCLEPTSIAIFRPSEDDAIKIHDDNDDHGKSDCEDGHVHDDDDDGEDDDDYHDRSGGNDDFVSFAKYSKEDIDDKGYAGDDDDEDQSPGNSVSPRCLEPTPMEIFWPSEDNAIKMRYYHNDDEGGKLLVLIMMMVMMIILKLAKMIMIKDLVMTMAILTIKLTVIVVTKITLQPSMKMRMIFSFIHPASLLLPWISSSGDVFFQPHPSSSCCLLVFRLP